uniref:Nucleolin-like n=1 Tax=Nicotiana tabacum TaxID=4097 RepID=A0A1S4A0L6_TOBAC|nr:PREDICTED: nucleolin-like [Nicotiana tabacum]
MVAAWEDSSDEDIDNDDDDDDDDDAERALITIQEFDDESDEESEIKRKEMNDEEIVLTKNSNAETTVQPETASQEGTCDGTGFPVDRKSISGAMVVWSEEISDNEETMNESMGIESQEISDGSGERSATDGQESSSAAKVSDRYNEKRKSKVGKTVGKGMGGTKRRSAHSISVATPLIRGRTTRIQKK